MINIAALWPFAYFSLRNSNTSKRYRANITSWNTI